MLMFIVNFARFLSPLGVLLFLIGFSMIEPGAKLEEEVLFRVPNLGIGTGLALEFLSFVIIGTAASQRGKPKSGRVGPFLAALGTGIALLAFFFFGSFLILKDLVASIYLMSEEPVRSVLAFASACLLLVFSVLGFDTIYRKFFPKQFEDLI